MSGGFRITGKPWRTKSGAHPVGARQGPLRPRRHRPERSSGRPGHRRQGQGGRRNHGGASSPAGQRPRSPERRGGHLAPVSGSDHRPAGDQRRRRAEPGHAIPFTISDLSSVWIVCDVYENDLPNVHIGDTAEIRLNAYPDRVQGKVSNIGAVLDPNIRTAKVRIEVSQSGHHAPGHVRHRHLPRPDQGSAHRRPGVGHPALHDRDWVYVPAPDKKFRRVEVVGGDPLPGNLQEIKSGIKPGQQVVPTPWSSSTCSRSVTRISSRLRHTAATLTDGNSNDSRSCRFCAQQPVCGDGDCVLLLGWGAISFHNLPVEAYPDIADNYVTVITQWPAGRRRRWNSRSRFRSKSR
jgi:hypothetical protein